MTEEQRGAARELLAIEAEQARRRKVTPLAYSTLWHRDPPRTSQRTALLHLLDPNVVMLAILGGNRTGKSKLLADTMVALAGGRDAVVEDGPRRVEWARMWMARNGLPEALIPPGPGRVWVGSPSFTSAVEQIRPHLLRAVPTGTRALRWDDKQSEAELRLPGGGVVVSKAYKQYDHDPQSWEGANVRAIGLDEQPNSQDNLTAAKSRLIDQRGKIIQALTPLRGTADWFYREVIHKAPPWLRVAYLHGADNPHIPQDYRELILASFPSWQRAARDVGAFVAPEGQILPIDRGVHKVPRLRPPPEWTRWQGIDWGARAPHIVWAAEVSSAVDGLPYRSGDLVVYRELAPRRTTMEPGVPASRLVQWAAEAERDAEDCQPDRHMVYRVADSEDPGAIQEAALAGFYVAPAAKGAGSVVHGLELMEALMSVVDPVTMEPARPRLYVTEDCPQLLEELEGLRWAEQREGADPKPDPACPDHGPDALRYILLLREAMGLR